MFALLVICLIVAGIKALFRLVTGAARREKEEERQQLGEQYRQEQERQRQERTRRKVIEDAKQQFEQAVMGGRFPSDEVLAILADCGSDIPTNPKEAVEELLYGRSSLHSMAFGDAVCLIQQRQRTEKRARNRRKAQRDDGAGAKGLRDAAHGTDQRGLPVAQVAGVAQWALSRK